MVKRDFLETSIINEINSKVKFISKVRVEEADQCLGYARAALEAAINLFWWEKYNLQIGEKRTDAPSSLFDAINDNRFTKYFSALEISDMNQLRIFGNKNLHGGQHFTLEAANELLRRLEQCIISIEKAIPMTILFSDTKATVPTKPTADKQIPVNTTLQNQIDNPKGPLELTITNQYVHYDWTSDVFSEGNGPVRQNQKNGFLAYNAQGDNIGIVYMADDERLKAFGSSEIMFLKKYQNSYGRWRIIKIQGQYLPFDELKRILSTSKNYKLTTDKTRGFV